MPLLDIRNLTIEIDTPQGRVRAVDRISLTLNEGEIRGLVGESPARARVWSPKRLWA